jgi:hypothetical protein
MSRRTFDRGRARTASIRKLSLENLGRKIGATGETLKDMHEASTGVDRELTGLLDLMHGRMLAFSTEMEMLRTHQAQLAGMLEIARRIARPEAMNRGTAERPAA